MNNLHDIMAANYAVVYRLIWNSEIHSTTKKLLCFRLSLTLKAPKPQSPSRHHRFHTKIPFFVGPFIFPIEHLCAVKKHTSKNRMHQTVKITEVPIMYSVHILLEKVSDTSMYFCQQSPETMGCTMLYPFSLSLEWSSGMPQLCIFPRWTISNWLP